MMCSTFRLRAIDRPFAEHDISRVTPVPDGVTPAPGV
jgi:hypothetical protein